jgi:integrase
MPRLKLTERTIEKLKAPDPSGRQVLYFDADLKGFGVLCSGVSNARTFIAQRDLPDGRTRRVTLGSVAEISLVTARARAADTLDDLRRGLDPKKKKRSEVTLREALDVYLQARKDLRPASIRVYRIAVERYLAAWADLPLRSINSDMVEDRHRSIAAEVGRGKRYDGHVTANMAMRHLRILYNFMAERVPDMPPNPVRRLRRQWYPERRRTRIVHAEDLPKFYEAICALENPIARDLIRLMLFTGMRVGEASSLTWADIDLRQRVITIPAARTKNKREFRLPMNNFVRDLLVARRALGNAKWVFPSWGKSGHIADPAFQLGLIAKATDIETSPHDLRRVFLSVAESCDISPLALKALVNHAGGNDVTSGYVVMSTERLREAAQRVAEKMKELCEIETPKGVSKLG